MAVNFFNSAMGVIDAGNDAWDQSQKRFDRFTTNRAGAQLAGGDRAGARQTFARGGLIQPARVLEQDQQADDDRAAEADDNERQAQAAQVKQRAEVLTGVARKLLTVPPGQRMQTLQRAMPLFEMAGVDPQMFATLTEDQLADDALQAFTGEVAKAAEEYTLPPGAKRFRGDQVIADNPAAPPRPTIVPQGSTVLGPDGKPVFTARKTYAPARGRSGGTSGGSYADLPPGAVVVR